MSLYMSPLASSEVRYDCTGVWLRDGSYKSSVVAAKQYKEAERSELPNFIGACLSFMDIVGDSRRKEMLCEIHVQLLDTDRTQEEAEKRIRRTGGKFTLHRPWLHRPIKPADPKTMGYDSAPGDAHTTGAFASGTNDANADPDEELGLPFWKPEPERWWGDKETLLH